MSLFSPSKKRSLSFLSVFAVSLISLFVFSDAAFAQTVGDFATEGKKLKTQIESLISLGKLVFIVIGFFSFGAGILYFAKDNKQPNQGHMKTGIIGILVGAACMVLSWLIGMVTNSVAQNQGGAAMDATKGAEW